jgi:glycosyltransferase involved in cell wall biosynthesis
MNVLHINQSDVGGGAAIAAYRLHQGLLAQGISSRLLVGSVKTDDELVTATPNKRYIEQWTSRITSRLGLNYINHLGTFDIPNHPFFQEADILNFHNLHYEHTSGYFNYLSIPLLTSIKPAVLTLHDMWSFTGHCAYSYDCDRWKIGCGRCPYPEAYPAIKLDSTFLEYRLKRWTYNHSNLAIISPSKWLMEQAQQSILNCFSIDHIPNGIDTDAYQPLDPHQCRSLLGLPLNKHILLFVADSLKDTRKGGDLMLQILQNLPISLKTEMLLITLGNQGEAFNKISELETINLGYVSNDRLKSIIYSSADLFLFPTRSDNLPLVLQESMACGTPMISFKIGGVPELVRPSITGYLAEPENVGEFCTGIAHLLKDQNLREHMSQQCRAIALKEFSLELQVDRYAQIYHKLLDK